MAIEQQDEVVRPPTVGDATALASPGDGLPVAGPLAGFTHVEQIALVATMLLPLPLLVYLGINGGGFGSGTTGVAATIVALLLALRALVAPRTVRRPGRLGLMAVAGLLGLAAWSLASAGWSDSDVRAIPEFNRAVLYALTVATFVTLPRLPLRPLVVVVGAGAVTIVLIGLATRLAPDHFAVAAVISPQRLSFPLGYWNALGVLAAMGLVLCLHAAADGAGWLPARVLGAALCPPLVTALYLTLSRGGIAAAVAGLAVYVVLGRTRSLVLAVLATAIPCYVVLGRAYDSTELISRDPTSALAVVQGHALLSTLLACAAAAGAARLILALLDAPILRLRLRLPRLRRRQRPAAWTAAVLLVVAAGFVLGGPHLVTRQFDRFVANAPTKPIVDQRARLGEVYNAHRISHWTVALDASRSDRWRGAGAGTFDLAWNRLRPGPMNVTQTHSLYVETLAELGIVGVALLIVVLGSLLAAPGTRWRTRPPAAAAVAVFVAWGLHAALDWDWEMPAVTLVPFVLCAAAASLPARSAGGPRRWTPLVVGLGALALAVIPAVTAVAETRLSQSLAAFGKGECIPATARAEQVRSLMPMRPEPYAVLALCAARDGRSADAVRLAGRAVAADPRDWEWRYLDALVLGSTGGDPRPELAAALERNPLGVPAVLRGELAESGRRGWVASTDEAYVWIHGKAYNGIAPPGVVKGRK